MNTLDGFNGGMRLPALPNGWVWTTLGKIAKQINSGFASGAHNAVGRGIPHLRPMNVDTLGRIDLSNLKYIETEEKYDFLAAGDEFVDCFQATNRSRHEAAWSDSNPKGRWRAYTCDELIMRDKASLDIFWLRDETLEETTNLPDLSMLATEIMLDLQAALEQFTAIADDRNE